MTTVPASPAPGSPAPLDAATERERRQRSRSIAIALGLLGLAMIFYAATIVRMGAAIQNQSIKTETGVIQPNEQGTPAQGNGPATVPVGTAKP